jgi:hypothetical protein
MFIDTTQEVRFSGEKQKAIVVQANGGSCTIAAKNAAGQYIDADTFSADFAGIYNTGSLTLRFTIVGGCTVELS